MIPNGFISLWRGGSGSRGKGGWKMYTLATSGKNGWEGQSVKGWLTEMSRPNGNGRSEDDSGRGRRESWMWSMVPGRGRVSQLSLFTFAHRPNISVTLATPLT